MGSAYDDDLWYRQEAQRKADAACRVAAALIVLAKFNIPPDIQELLVSGNPMRDIPPGALAAAISQDKQGTP